MQYLILHVFWQLLPIFNFWKEEWALGCISIYISHFSNISKFPKILSPKSFSNSFSNSCTKFVMLDIKYCFTCGDSDLREIIKKCQNIMARIVDSSYLASTTHISPSFQVFCCKIEIVEKIKWPFASGCN